jgi:Mrp family chromosome partitioning ATPase/capsular polysaccharide biosynthesis protein
MEPVAYLQILKRRWWIIVLLVVAAVGIVYAVTPARFVDHYQATHVLLVEGNRESSDTSAANPEVVALWAKDDAVLRRAAAEIGPEIDPKQLGRDITVGTNRAVDTVSITAEDENAELAARKANAVADQTVAFLTEREAARQKATNDELDAREADLRGRISDLDAAIDRNPPDVETITAERDALIRQLGDVLDAQNVESAPAQYTSIDVPDRGSRQERPIGTRTREQRMILAAIVALVLGFGLAIILDRSDTRLRTRRSAEEHFGLPVIAEIVGFPLWSRHRRLAVVRQPDSAVAESFRTLRSSLMLLGPVEGAARRRAAAAEAPPTNGERPAPAGAEVIMVTSAATDEGKTTTVANLAAAYGESGQSVVVLNFDLKRVRMGRRRSRDARRPGISDYFAAPTPPPLETLLRDTGVPGVRVVSAGRAVRPPGGQLAAQHKLLEEARSLADVVIIDTAPLLASSIARELATMADSVVVLCRVGRTTVSEAERCGDLLAQVGAPALGVVLIGVSAPTSSEYFAYFALRRDRRAEAGSPQVIDTVAAPAPVSSNGSAPVADHAVTANGSEPAAVDPPDENGHARPATPQDLAADDG